MQIKGADKKKYGMVDVLLMLALSVELHGTCDAVKATALRLLNGLHALTDDAAKALKSIVESGDSVAAAKVAVSVWEPDFTLVEMGEEVEPYNGVTPVKFAVDESPTMGKTEAVDPPSPDTVKAVEVTFGFNKKPPKGEVSKSPIVIGGPRLVY